MKIRKFVLIMILFIVTISYISWLISGYIVTWGRYVDLVIEDGPLRSGLCVYGVDHWELFSMRQCQRFPSVLMLIGPLSGFYLGIKISDILYK